MTALQIYRLEPEVVLPRAKIRHGLNSFLKLKISRQMAI
jgi:hypothetical protein